MKFEIQYSMNDTVIDTVVVQGDSLLVQLVHQQNGQFEYRSKDRDEDVSQVAPHTMSLPICLLHAVVFFGMLPPGAITEDVYSDCEYEF